MKTPFAQLEPRGLTRLGLLWLLLFFFLSFLLRRWTDGAWSDVLDLSSGVALGAALAFVLLAARAKGRLLRGLETGPCE